MKSVGETMAIGRTFKESLQKALRGLETGRFGLGCDRKDRWGTPRQPDLDEIISRLATPNARTHLVHPLRLQGGHDRRRRSTSAPRSIRWFLHNIREIVDMEERAARPAASSSDGQRRAAAGSQAARLLRPPARQPVEHRATRKSAGMRKARGIEAVFKLVDTCAAEFEAYTPYYYSTYEAAGRSMRIADRATDAATPASRGRNPPVDAARSAS